MKMNQYNSALKIESVTLNTQKMAQQVAYYQQVIGMEVLEQTPQKTQLGVSGKVLLTLQEAQEAGGKDVAGLYHTAFLLPTAKDLGDFLYHILTNRIPIVGAADHGYSQAIYLEDVEGNGIEVYADRPMETWEMDSTGRPIGKTEELDGDALLALATRSDHYHAAEGTIIGHVHLASLAPQKSAKAFELALPIAIKSVLGGAYFVAAGDYHHDFAFNAWERRQKVRQKGQVGLDHISVSVSDAFWLALLAQRAKGDDILEKTERGYRFTDESGISVLILPA